MGQQPLGCQPGQPLVAKTSSNGHFEVVELLLKQPGVDPTAYNNDAIIAANLNGHLEVVKLLQKHRMSLR